MQKKTKKKMCKKKKLRNEEEAENKKREEKVRREMQKDTTPQPMSQANNAMGPTRSLPPIGRRTTDQVIQQGMSPRSLLKKKKKKNLS